MFSNSTWSDARIQRALQWLITQHLFEPGDLIDLSQLQPYRLLSDRALTIYKLIFITLTSLVLGSFFGLLYGPSFTFMVISLIVPPIPDVAQPWAAVWDIFIPLMQGWLKASWLLGIFVSWFGLLIGSWFGAFKRISAPGRWRLHGKRSLKLIAIIVSIGIVLSLTILEPYSAFGTVMALVPNLVLFGGLKQLPERDQGSRVFLSKYWWMILVTNVLFLTFLFAYVLGMIRLSLVRFDISLLPWPLSLSLPWIDYWVQSIPSLSFGSLVGLVFLLRSPVVSRALEAFQIFSLRLTLFANRKLPWNQTKLFDRAAELGLLKKQRSQYQVHDFGVIMAEAQEA